MVRVVIETIPFTFPLFSKERGTERSKGTSAQKNLLVTNEDESPKPHPARA